MTQTQVEHPRIASEGEWLEERKRLLAHEKELTGITTKWQPREDACRW